MARPTMRVLEFWQTGCEEWRVSGDYMEGRGGGEVLTAADETADFEDANGGEKDDFEVKVFVCFAPGGLRGCDG